MTGVARQNLVDTDLNESVTAGYGLMDGSALSSLMKWMTCVAVRCSCDVLAARIRSPARRGEGMVSSVAVEHLFDVRRYACDGGKLRQYCNNFRLDPRHASGGQ